MLLGLALAYMGFLLFLWLAPKETNSTDKYNGKNISGGFRRSSISHYLAMEFYTTI